MSLTFVRHAETWANASGDYSTATGDLLPDNGLAQAQRLAAALLRRPAPARIVVSPMTRALQTIRPYLMATGRTGEIWPELAEGCWQEPEAGEANDWPAEPCVLADEFVEWFEFRNGQALHPCGGESYAQGRYRAKCVLQRLQSDAREEGADTLVVTHGHLLREMMNVVVAAERLVRFEHDNCAMTRVWWKGSWMVEFVNRPPASV